MIFTVSGGNAGMRSAGAYVTSSREADAAHFPSAPHAAWAETAAAAVAAPRKRRTAAATLAFVNRGFI